MQQLVSFLVKQDVTDFLWLLDQVPSSDTYRGVTSAAPSYTNTLIQVYSPSLLLRQQTASGSCITQKKIPSKDFQLGGGTSS